MVLKEENKIVHGLWIGNKLSEVEMLTLHSFTSHGHIFYLWVYNELENTLPKGVILKDANVIIAEKNIFRKKENDPKFKIGKGSVGSPFSDLFRYKLLYELGGWWVDMDVTCLKPFNILEPYFFRAHPLIPVIGNIIKVPKHSDLMKQVYDETLATCNEDTVEWLLPNKILNKHIDILNLYHYTRNDLSETDWWEKVCIYILTDKKMPENWMFIHWMNEEWRVRDLDKNNVYEDTSIGKLFQQYQLSVKPLPLIKKWWYKVKYQILG